MQQLTLEKDGALHRDGRASPSRAHGYGLARRAGQADHLGLGPLQAAHGSLDINLTRYRRGGDPVFFRVLLADPGLHGHMKPQERALSVSKTISQPQ